MSLSNLLKDNWNRMAELTQKSNWGNDAEKAEIDYRVSVQNYYATNGKLPENYIPSKNIILGGTSKFNREYALAKNQKRPFFVIERHGGKLTTIKYDMFTVDYDLTDESSKTIYKIFMKICESDRRDRWFSCSTTYGSLPKVLVETALQNYYLIFTILNDPNNHHPINL